MNTQGTVAAPGRSATAEAAWADRYAPRLQDAGHGPHPSAPGGRNGPAVAATVLGGVGAATSVVLVGGLFGVAGVIVGVVALRTARRTGVGRGRAVTGVVLSSFAVVASVLVVFLALWFAGRTQSCYRFDELGPWRQCVGEQLFGG